MCESSRRRGLSRYTLLRGLSVEFQLRGVGSYHRFHDEVDDRQVLYGSSRAGCSTPIQGTNVRTRPDDTGDLRAISERRLTMLAILDTRVLGHRGKGPLLPQAASSSSSIVFRVDSCQSEAVLSSLSAGDSSAASSQLPSPLCLSGHIDHHCWFDSTCLSSRSRRLTMSSFGGDSSGGSDRWSIWPFCQGGKGLMD